MTQARERQIDALVAEKVMGWKRRAGGGSTRTRGEYTINNLGDVNRSGSSGSLWRYFRPSSEPFDDYAVLNHVRYTWDSSRLSAFARCLDDIWRERRGRVCSAFPHLDYRPGDYSLAALRALGVEVEAP